MNKINYQKELDKVINRLEQQGRVPRLLLHSCCAPCSSYVLEYLSRYFEITVFYYNPNIYPPEEFGKRVEEQKRLIAQLPAEHPISFLDGPYEPERFYAYIRRSADGTWIGDVNFHYTPEKDWWDMGIVMYAPYRGKGYAVPALRLMLDHAFRVCGISRIHNDFEIARNEIAAWETHRKAGFKELGVENGFLHMMITKEAYLGAAQNVSADDPINPDTEMG